MATYAWRITVDNLVEAGTSDPEESEVGVTGPRDAPAELLARLDRGEGHTFRMYDDDGILYYTGKAVWRDDAGDHEDHLVGPLRDFGSPNAGAVLIRWHGKPDWTCEY